jgi:hypothetical protein
MNRQRNNVSSLPYELRHEVSRLLFEGFAYAVVAQEITKRGGGRKLHNTSLGAWQRSPEYQEYVAARKGFDAETRKARLAAAIQAAGNGPGALADVAAFELLQRILSLVPDAADDRSAAALASAVSQLKRAQIAEHVAADQSRIMAMERKLAEQAAAASSREAALREQIAALQTGGQSVDAAAVAARLNQLLGLGQASAPQPTAGGAA